MADRYFFPNLRNRHVTLTGDEARHLIRVARIKPGDRVELFDGRGLGCLARVCALGKLDAKLELEGEPSLQEPPLIELTLATAVPKGERLDWLVEKATELGVHRLVPLMTDRSVVEPRDAKLERVRRIVLAASKQCGRNRLMEVAPVMTWDENPRFETATNLLLAHQDGEPFSSLPMFPKGSRVVLAVGPEGGWTEAEIEARRAAGWRAVSLGSTRLRIETAALAGCAMIWARTGGEPI